MMDLWCIEFLDSIQWLKFFNQSDELNLQVIESTPLGMGHTSVFQSKPEQENTIRSILQNINKAIEFQIIKQPHENLLPGYLNIKNVEITQSILAFESESLGKILSVADIGLKLGAELIEIRFPRLKPSKTFLLLSGNVEQLQGLIKNRNSEGFLTKENFYLIEKPGTALKFFYNF